jgi:hypothetical protein
LWCVVFVGGGGELAGGGEGDRGGVLAWVVVGGGAAVVVGAGLLLVVTGVAVDLDLWVAAFFLCVAFLWMVAFFLVVVAAGLACAACFDWLVVLDDPPQAASATAATITVASFRFIGPPFGSSGTVRSAASSSEPRGSQARFHPPTAVSPAKQR